MKELFVDAWTVMDKELRELAATRSGVRGSLLGIILLLVVVGAILPLESSLVEGGQSWLLTMWGWLPIFVVAITVTDLIAGERERHTLETLLASRLPGRAILLGKVGAAIVLGWGLMALCIMIAIVVIALIHGENGLSRYSAGMLLGVALLGMSGAVLAASVSALISLRAATARQAHQIVSVALLLIFIIHVVGLPLLGRVLPGPWQAGLAVLLGALQHPDALFFLAVILAVLGIGLLGLAAFWFQRSRLNLD